MYVNPMWRWTWGKPRTCLRDYLSHLAHEHPRISPEELEEVATGKDIWAALLSHLSGYYAVVCCTGVTFIVSTPYVIHYGLQTTVLHAHKKHLWLVILTGSAQFLNCHTLQVSNPKMTSWYFVMFFCRKMSHVTLWTTKFRNLNTYIFMP